MLGALLLYQPQVLSSSLLQSFLRERVRLIQNLDVSVQMDLHCCRVSYEILRCSLLQDERRLLTRCHEPRYALR